MEQLSKVKSISLTTDRAMLAENLGRQCAPYLTSSCKYVYLQCMLVIIPQNLRTVLLCIVYSSFSRSSIWLIISRCVSDKLSYVICMARKENNRRFKHC